MAKIKLYGKRRVRTLEVKLPDSRMDTSTLTPPTRNEKAAFAHMRELGPKLNDVSENDVWEYIKSHYGNVSSRTEFSEMDWATIAARLYAAKTDAKLRDNLNNAVRRFKDGQANGSQTPNDTVQ